MKTISAFSQLIVFALPFYGCFEHYKDRRCIMLIYDCGLLLLWHWRFTVVALAILYGCGTGDFVWLWHWQFCKKKKLHGPQTFSYVIICVYPLIAECSMRSGVARFLSSEI